MDEHGVVLVGYREVRGAGGGVARSTDGGQSFTLLRGMNGESVRALAVAPSNSKVIAAGTLTGVFLSRDGGEHWKRITPAGDPDLRNIESLAFDSSDTRDSLCRHLAPGLENRPIAAMNGSRSTRE